MSYNSKRTGAEVETLLNKAETALQSVPSEYVTEGVLNEGLEGKVDKVSGKQLSTEDFTAEDKQKLDGLSNYDDTEIKANLEQAGKLAYDAFMVASRNEQNKVDKIEGKGLSTEDFTTTEKQKLEGLSNYDDAEIRASIEEMRTIIGSHSKEIKFFCIESVTVKVGGIEYNCEANQIATVFVGDEEFEIIPTSAKSIKSLLNYPIPLTWFDWLEGVDVFENIIFDMNTLEMSQKWTQYHQGDYHVQKAQYSNCIFWSDKPYTHSPFEERTNYTLYYTSQLPLCYAINPANTYKPFYFAYGVQNDPNWRNPDYINSFASLASGAPQTFSYYGAKAIGIYNYDVDVIKLCKDARGLMYDSSAIEHAGIFDASNTTNFGAKKGSWQDAFGKCYSLTDLFIKNLKASINVSWSPINNRSIEYIVNNAINTSKITISLSPYTWYRLTDEIRTAASSKNIALELITTNYVDDSRWATKQDTIADLETIREGAAKGATALQSYTEQYKGTVTGIKVNGSTHNPSNGVVDLGTISADESLRIHFEPNFDLGIGQPIDVTSLVQQSMGITPAELYEEVVTNEKKTALFIHELMGGELQEISRVTDPTYGTVGLSYLSTLEGLPSPLQLIISTTQCQLVIVDMLAGYNSVVAPLTEMVEGKQEQLVSGTNIKTINGESILGSGNIEVSYDDPELKVVNHESSDTNVELTPYVTHKWGTISSLTLTFSESTESEYNVVFEANDADFVLSIPQNIRWANSQIPQFEAKKQYEINIKGERALYAVFDAPYIEGTFLEYIENDGVDYILTDIYITKSMSGMRCKSMILTTPSSNVALAGTRNTASGTDTAPFIMWYLTSGRYLYWNGVRISGFGSFEPNVAYTDEHSGDAISLDCSYPIAIFGVNNQGRVQSGSAFRLYYLELLDSNGNTIVNLCPFKRTYDNAIGLLDKVSGTFYPSNNGNLIGG